MSDFRLVDDPENPGRQVEAVNIPIKTAEEPFTRIRLTDGTTLTMRMTIVEALRLNDRWNKDGQPIYTVTCSGSMSIASPPELLKKDA